MDTKDLIFFTRDELMEPETALQVLTLGEQIVRGLATADAYRLFKALRRILTNWEDQRPGIPSALEQHYARLRNLTRVIAIPLLNDEEVIGTVKESLVESLHHSEFDLNAYKTIFKRKLLTFPVTERDTYKEELRRALHENQERLTKQYLVGGEKEQLGTVGKWLSDYIQAVGGGEVDSLRRAEYFARQRLDGNDRAAVQKLIDLYEFLKLSSVSAQGVEEYLSAYYPELGKYFILNEQGFAEEIPEVTAVFNKTTDVEVQKPRNTTPPKVVSVEARTKVETKPPLNLPLGKGESEGVDVAVSKKLPILLPQILHANHPLRIELEELIDNVMQNVKLKMQNVTWVGDPVLEKRFRAIISARLRDIRDATETREMIMRDRKVGGMGLTEVLGARDQGLDQLTNIIESAFLEFQKKWKDVEDKRRAERKKEQQDQSRQQEQLKAEQEQKGLEERYRKLVGERATVPRQQLAQKTQSVRPASEPLLGARPRSPDAAVGDHARSASATLLPQAAGTEQARTSRPPRPTVIPSLPPPSRPLPAAPIPTPRPYTLTPRPSAKITDIRQPAKLMGPLDELRSLTLEDFRKLGGQVQERVDKILGKLEFIGQESLSRRMAAIAAWKQSPLYGLYGKITAEALTQKVSPEQLAQGQTTLTREEFYAIMELNQKLRF